MPVPKVILDTSTIIMPITRPASSHRWLLDAWQDGLILPIISEDTQEELLKVMHYPQFEIVNGSRTAHCTQPPGRVRIETNVIVMPAQLFAIIRFVFRIAPGPPAG